jgi:hypothetical protein
MVEKPSATPGFLGTEVGRRARTLPQPRPLLSTDPKGSMDHPKLLKFNLSTSSCSRENVVKLLNPKTTHTMPPRIPARLTAQCCRTTLDASNSTSLVGVFAALSIQTRNASILSDLRDNRGAYQKRIRLGRGPSSGKGKTSGRGMNGQKAHGKVNPWFQGGQTPLLFSRGRYGFDNLYVFVTLAHRRGSRIPPHTHHQPLFSQFLTA